jgi:predicted alpha-1,6-mannanase (GH76 family)
MWAVIAMTRAYRLTGIQKYFDTAKANFDMVWARAYSSDLGGGLWWRTDNQSKNACVNCPGVIAACLVGEVAQDESYFEKANDVMEWTVKELTEENGKVYDCYGINGDKNHWSSTYNQGTYIGGNMLLYKHYGNEVYKNRAAAAASYAMNEMYHGEVMDNEDWGNDVIGFKAILSRWLRLYALSENKPEYIEWLRKNADAAYANRNSEGIMMTKFATKTEEIYYDVFGTSAAVGVMFNCI